MEIEGEPAKRFKVFRTDIDDKPYECLAEYDTIDEVRAHRWRLDQRYRIWVGGQFMTRAEFEAWAKEQKKA